MYTYPIDALMQFNGNRISDHNRTPISVDYEELKNQKRMVDGTLRKYLVARKKNFSVSWTDLFRDDATVADGFWAANSLKTFYDNTPGEFTLTITYGNGEVENYLVMIDSFSFVLSKRTAQRDFYDISISLVEV